MDFETLVEQFWELAKNNPDGFTFSLELETPTAGYCVAFKATQDSFGKEGLKKCLNHAIDNAGFVGGWRNPQGELQFDSVAILSDKAKAIEAGRKEAQYSIFDLNDLEEIIL